MEALIADWISVGKYVSEERFSKTYRVDAYIVSIYKRSKYDNALRVAERITNY